MPKLHNPPNMDQLARRYIANHAKTIRRRRSTFTAQFSNCDPIERDCWLFGDWAAHHAYHHTDENGKEHFCSSWVVSYAPNGMLAGERIFSSLSEAAEYIALLSLIPIDWNKNRHEDLQLARDTAFWFFGDTNRSSDVPRFLRKLILAAEN